VHGASSVIPNFREQGHGALVNASSIVVFVPQPYTSAYIAFSAAICALSDRWRQKLRERAASMSAQCCPPRSTRRCATS
jgi:short-subunit dehydrogenase